MCGFYFQTFFFCQIKTSGRTSTAQMGKSNEMRLHSTLLTLPLLTCIILGFQEEAGAKGYEGWAICSPSKLDLASDPN